MNDMFRCGDEAGLVSYAYDDCEPAERALIAAHVATCASCADVVASMVETRHLLAAWTPPEARLGFRITADASAPVDERRGSLVAAFGGPAPQQWWRQPLPAWAQLAAAAIIFGVGLTVGASSGWRTDASVADLRQTLSALEGRVVETRALAEGASAAVPVASGLRPTLAALEQRISDVEARTRMAPSAATVQASLAVGGPNRSVERMLRDLIAESERRQDEKLAVRMMQTRSDQRERQAFEKESMEKAWQRQFSNLEGAVRNISFALPR